MGWSYNSDLLLCVFLGAVAELRKTTITFLTSVRLSSWNNSAPTRRILMAFDIRVFIENLIQVS